MVSYNRIILGGNVTRDMECIELSGNKKVCRFGLAMNHKFKDIKTGEYVKKADFIDIEVWNNVADYCIEFINKGRFIMVEGRLKQDTWQDKETGKNRSKHKVVVDRIIPLTPIKEQEEPEYNAEDDIINKQYIDQVETIKKKLIEAAKNTETPDSEEKPVRRLPF